MNVVCLDLEGVLVPEIWIAFAEASGIPELRRTTRDEPDYDKLMKFRLGILKVDKKGWIKEIETIGASYDEYDAKASKDTKVVSKTAKRVPAALRQVLADVTAALKK